SSPTRRSSDIRVRSRGRQTLETPPREERVMKMSRACSVFMYLLYASCSLSQSDIERRLEALAPSDPKGYFLLAEDVADQARGVEETQLARKLYVLAFVLAQKNQTKEDVESQFPIAASACLGLADLEPTQARKRWLHALAGRLDERYAARRW